VELPEIAAHAFRGDAAVLAVVVTHLGASSVCVLNQSSGRDTHAVAG
jgi:hypothetical protein